MTLPKLFGPDMLADPYPVYRQLRESSPVVRDEPLRAWGATGYGAVSAGMRNALFSPDRGQMAHDRLAERGLAHFAADHFKPLIHRDPPAHTRRRGPVNEAFTPTIVAGLAGRIQAVIRTSVTWNFSGSEALANTAVRRAVT